MTSAAEYAAATLTPEHSHVAGVFLYRSQVLYHDPRKSRGAFWSHEYRPVPNPRASVPFLDMHFNVPVGLFTLGEPRNTMFFGAHEVPLKNTYMLSGGKIAHAGAAKFNGIVETLTFPFHAAHVESLAVLVKTRRGNRAQVRARPRAMDCDCLSSGLRSFATP